MNEGQQLFFCINLLMSGNVHGSFPECVAASGPALRSHTVLRIVSQLFFSPLKSAVLFSEAKINTLITPDFRKCAQCEHKDQTLTPGSSQGFIIVVVVGQATTDQLTHSDVVLRG